LKNGPFLGAFNLNLAANLMKPDIVILFEQLIRVFFNRLVALVNFQSRINFLMPALLNDIDNKK
jgi:hypothetical protein